MKANATHLRMNLFSCNEFTVGLWYCDPLDTGSWSAVPSVRVDTCLTSALL